MTRLEKFSIYFQLTTDGWNSAISFNLLLDLENRSIEKNVEFLYTLIT